MATLNRVTMETKLIFKGIGILILIYILINVGIFIKKQLLPTPNSPPTAAFGQLPSIDFSVSVNSKNFLYAIDTLTGSLPAFPDRISVYKINPIKPDLLSFEKTKTLAHNLGFKSGGIPVSDNVYAWEDQDSPSRKIVIDIFSSDFTLTSLFLSAPNDSPNIKENQAIDAAKTFLQNMSLLSKDIDNDNIRTDSSDPTNVKVDFFQFDINTLPIYYPHMPTSTMSFTVKNVGDKTKVVAANFIHQEVSEESATYPIKTADAAFSELKEGKAYVVSYSGKPQNILIKNVFLAYYLGEKRQDYLMPIIVFQGDNEFLAYVSAVNDEWLDN